MLNCMSEDEQKRDQVLERMLNTKPKPQSEEEQEKNVDKDVHK